MKTDFQKLVAVFFQIFKLISNQENLIHKTKTYVKSILTKHKMMSVKQAHSK